ncbi:hypothetical protein DFH29DRAFT_880914 [Suillus ampliporus]|nr:hypothetical protein DFH29DRAFT_880914 [Suillus ampliporus]
MHFTSQFVALTSICAIIAIVLPPPADAAYIANHPSSNRVATAYQADKLRAVFSLPRLTAGRVNKSSEGKGKANVNTPSSRFFRFADSDPLNPLAGIRDFSFSHDVHPPFSPRDAFPRRPTPLSRRSSALVHGAGGNDYLVSRGAASTRPSTRRLGRRDDSSRVSGTIDIMSGAQGQHLASLALDSPAYNSTNTTSSNSTGGHASNGSFPLNASSTKGTQFYLVDATDNDSFNNSENATKHVMVQTDVSDSTYCATFDPNPSGPEPMVMEMCLASQPKNDIANLDYSYPKGLAPIVDYTILAVDPHKSQIFEYNPSTGVIKPVWTNSGGSTSSRAMFVERDSSTSTTTGSNTITSTESSTASSTSAPQPTASSSTPQAQDVTLVFRPSDLAVSAPSPSASTADSSVDDVIVTTTITTTVVYTATATASSSSSSAAGSPMAAVAALTMTSSSTPAGCSSTSTSTSTPSPAVHAAVAASSAGSSSSQATSAGSATTQTTSSSMPLSPVQAAIVTSSLGSSSSQATSTGSATIQATSSSMPPSPSIHAAIVASSAGSSSSQATSMASATTPATSSSMPPSPSVQAAIVASSPGSSSSQATSMTGSTTTTQATSTSQDMRGSLEIEFVPVTASPSSASITPSSSSSSPSSSPTSSLSATPSQMNAAAIASGIANSRSSASTASGTSMSSSSASSSVAPTTTGK